MKRLFYLTILFSIQCIFIPELFAQNGIISISPAEAGAGQTVSVTITLDANAVPPPPPADKAPESVKIGTVDATSFTHNTQTEITASFTFPSGISSGS